MLSMMSQKMVAWVSYKSVVPLRSTSHFSGRLDRHALCRTALASSRQYRTKIVRQMRRQIFRQMKQKAEWILDVFTSIFVKYESLFRIWRMQIASSDFLRDEGKNGENPLWIFEYFPEISRKICTQDACGKIRNRLWRDCLLYTSPSPRDGATSRMPSSACQYGEYLLSLSLIHIWRCRRLNRCRSRWSPYH